ncbi:MAG: ATPase [Proteobacteria bacterium]|nr:ATPase [Pseudomonadota bacterium]
MTDAPTQVRAQSVQHIGRFYKAVDVAPAAGGWAVQLDGRTARTPDRAALVLPTPSLARLVADEWAAQGKHIVFATMPATRLAFTALDRAPGAHEALAEEVARYAGSDLLCYFAEAPRSLLDRQTAAWSPVLDWAESELGLRFQRAAGIVHRPQPPETLARVRDLAAALDPFALTALAYAAPLFGSAVLSLAVEGGRLSGAEAFTLSRLDEIHQEEAWGVDAEAAERTAALQIEAETVDRWFAALR